ncbi:MAG: cytochrome c biogenesis protein CcsA [Magnetococcales bacterium]|nr:cytochrome c biogenesis protein CcsA [Magnetococcales bacterium]MBF0150729.1 cytochrome c biogenesis protein CcsA [Magnetococcales bacterium]MBF0174051.1 cytochrome c biogenesis protein CcsA [Magnetococcales bacterium]MBF0346042.1 cytochrome c biogenesis protein CcsA [Magnetococcales bacterium]MBF0631819.1 cytochrome c biogenesis protein CcsA [Magnetococcales bacterium]
MDEQNLLWLAMFGYMLAGMAAVANLFIHRSWDRIIMTLLSGGVLLHALSLGLRWQRLGHGPFISMFEILSSNLWSLTVAVTLFYWFYPTLRATAAVTLPTLFILMAWLMETSPADTAIPPTYDTPWLYVHIGFGKVALGAVLVAVGISGIILLRTLGQVRLFARLPDSPRLDTLSYRFMALGFIFHSLMLVAGAIWSLDAWGRYWSWDPLETWTLHTWLLLALYLHLRPLFHPPPMVGAFLVWATFIFAFLVFFGIPFVSQAPHQGVV